MRRSVLIGLGIVFIGLGAWEWSRRDAGPAHMPKPVPGALVHLPFEGGLDNLGSAVLDGAVQDGELRFRRGATGEAFFAEGDGSQLRLTPQQRITPNGDVAFSFDVAPEDWVNPYERGAPVRTVVVFTGRSGEKLRHLTFNLTSGRAPLLRVRWERADGAKAMLVSDPGSIGTGWHNIRLVVSPETEETRLFLDRAEVGRIDSVPSVVTHGIDRMQIGTWFRQNQAFRGLVDNLVITGGG